MIHALDQIFYLLLHLNVPKKRFARSTSFETPMDWTF